MARTRILILDDERDWLYRHKGWLEEAGFECIATQLAEEAVAIAIEDPSIQIAIIDEILEVDGLKQDMQGSDVRDEIRKQRSDIQFIIVTYSPQFKSEDRAKERDRNISDIAVLLDEQRKLERESQVIHVFHKRHFDNKQTQNTEYKYLIQEINRLLRASQPVNVGQVNQIILPSLWVILTVSGDFFSGLEGRKRQKPRDFFQDNFSSQSKLEPSKINELVRVFARQMRELDKSNRHKDSIDALSKQPKFQILKRALYSKKLGGKELKELRLSKPGSRKYFQPLIKPNTRLFSILEFLAWKVEGCGEKSISEDEFRNLCGQPIRDSNNNTGIPSATRRYDNRSNEGGTFGSGVGTEGSSEKNLRLKVAIQRIENKLADPKFGFPSKDLFICEEGKSTYTPLFDIGILFERSDPGV